MEKIDTNYKQQIEKFMLSFSNRSQFCSMGAKSVNGMSRM